MQKLTGHQPVKKLLAIYGIYRHYQCLPCIPTRAILIQPTIPILRPISILSLRLLMGLHKWLFFSLLPHKCNIQGPFHPSCLIRHKVNGRKVQTINPALYKFLELSFAFGVFSTMNITVILISLASQVCRFSCWY